jgi:hypothetical protein
MEREIVPHDGNSQKSFTTLPPKSNGQIKTRVRPTEFHPILQSLGMKHPMEFALSRMANYMCKMFMLLCS